MIQKAAELGTDKVVLTGMYRFDYSDRKAVAGLVKDLNASGERLSRSGIALLYHNHNCEFRKVEKGRTAYDMIIEETDPRYVGFELDSYWPTEAGISAIALMRRLGERMRLYHINDRGTKVTGPSMTPILRPWAMKKPRSFRPTRSMLSACRRDFPRGQTAACWEWCRCTMIWSRGGNT